jgi:hypothetical protein
MESVTPEQLRDQLFVIFPAFKAHWDDEDEAFNYHRVIADFAYYFGHDSATFSEKQVRAFANIVNEAVAGGGTIENAISTGFLEHMRQIGVEKILRPSLSREAKNSFRA